MEHSEAVKKVAELMDGIKLCMLVTVNEQGQLVSRPMGLQEVEFDGDLWFFTDADSAKVRELMANPQTNVSFNSKNSWVSLSGRAEVVNDMDKAASLWHASLKAWFPDELKTPGLRLLKIHADSAEYWDISSNKLVNLFGMAKAATTGKRPNLGENEVVDL